MAKVKAGFKVLRVSNRRLESATDIGAILRYYTNKINYPKLGDGPLCVFTKLKYALEFRHNIGMGAVCIYTCEYQVSRRKKVWTFDNPIGRSLNSLPLGKALAEWVSLQKRLK